MEETSANKPNATQNIDVNNPDFYENVQAEMDTDLARMKKTVEVLMNLRFGSPVCLVTAAEVEVETAALFHAELWYHLLDIHNSEEHLEEEEDEYVTDDDDEDNN